jgi:hypothetical protein
MEAAGTSATSADFYQSTWRNNPEGSRFDRKYFSLCLKGLKITTKYLKYGNRSSV